MHSHPQCRIMISGHERPLNERHSSLDVLRCAWPSRCCIILSSAACQPGVAPEKIRREPAQSLPAPRCSRLQTPSALPWHGDAHCRRRAQLRPRVPHLRECRLETKTSTCDKKCASLRLEPRVLLLADRASTAAVRGMTEKTVGSSETLPWLLLI